jgi:hypothetical protein
MSKIAAVYNTPEDVDQNCNKVSSVKGFAQKNFNAGYWPYTEAAVWALKAGAPENGFGEAFLKIGRRVLVAEDRFWQAVAKLQEVKNVRK